MKEIDTRTEKKRKIITKRKKSISMSNNKISITVPKKITTSARKNNYNKM